MKRRITFLHGNVLISTAYVAVLASLGWALAHSSGPFVLALFFIALAIPIFLFGTYLAMLKRTYELSASTDGSLMRRWLARPGLRLVLGVLAAAGAAGILLMRISVLTWTDTALVMCGVTIFGGCLVFLGDWLRSQSEAPFRNGWTLVLCAFIAAALMSLIELVIRLFLGHGAPHETLSEAILKAREEASWLGDSAIADMLIGWGGGWAGLERYLGGRLSENPGAGAVLGLLISGLIRFPLYFAANFTICALLLPVREYTRLFAPIRADGEVETISSGRIAWLSASTAIVILFIYFPVVAALEGIIEKRPYLRSPEATAIRSLELIGFEYYSPGTKEELDQLAASMMAGHDGLMDAIEVSLEAGFDRMRENVDLYLDWYYSLPGEWSRLASLLVGNVEDHLESRLTEFLTAEEPFERFQRELEFALSVESQRQEEFRSLAEDILEARRVEIHDEEDVQVELRARREEVLWLPSYTDVTTLNQRLGATVATSGLAGVVAAAATRQVMVRVAARGTLRAAATAITRLAAVRAATSGGGVSAGALAGGAIGSVFPGVGTAVGAVVGGIVGGVSAGTGAEFLILKMEEFWARDQHREELLAAINEAEATIRRDLRVSDVATSTGGAGNSGE